MCAHTDLLPALGGEEMTRKFLQEVSNILWAYIHKSNQQNSKVCLSVSNKVHALKLNHMKADICLVFICKHLVH